MRILGYFLVKYSRRDRKDLHFGYFGTDADFGKTLRYTTTKKSIEEFSHSFFIILIHLVALDYSLLFEILFFFSKLFISFDLFDLL